MKTRAVVHAVGATVFTAVVTLFLMSVYATNRLEGEIANHVLSSQRFGAPGTVTNHGYRVFYETDATPGWDGQFYFYIANDLLARADTAEHLDAPAYRYQRIGVPLLAAALERLTFRTWVTPKLYYVTNVALVLLATLVGALFYAKREGRAWPILLWSCSAGVQLTLLNGLPDAGADALLLLALIAYVERRTTLFALFATLAALSREAYVLLPVVIGLFDSRLSPLIGALRRRVAFGDGLQRVGGRLLAWWRAGDAPTGVTPLMSVSRLAASSTSRSKPPLWASATPVAVFVAWQAYLRVRFDVGASEQAAATRILGFPFRSWWKYLSAALRSEHPLFAPGVATQREAVALIAFGVLFVACAAVATMAWRRRDADPIRGPVAAVFLALLALYACFGDTVMFHFSGYLKTAGAFVIAVPLLWGVVRPVNRYKVAGLLLIADLLNLHDVWVERVDPDGIYYDQYTRQSQVTNTGTLPCLRRFRADIRIVGIEDVPRVPIIGDWVAAPSNVFRIAMTNRADERFDATSAPTGSVNLSYEWLNPDGSLFQDGIRTWIPKGLAPGATDVLPIVVEYPRRPGHYTLRISPVQEFCGWFVEVDRSNGIFLDYEIR